MTNHQLTNHQLINQTSGKTEYFTPQPIIEAARGTMGEIDLDPASSSLANNRVKACGFFEESNNGLSMPWNGRVWLNHPFSRENNAKWIAKLVGEFQSRRISEACCITFASTSEKWFKPLLYYPQCFLVPRTEYLLPDGSKMRGVTKGSVVTYLGPNTDRFAREFSKLGVVKVRYQPATSSLPSQPQ